MLDRPDEPAPRSKVPGAALRADVDRHPRWRRGLARDKPFFLVSENEALLLREEIEVWRVEEKLT